MPDKQTIRQFQFENKEVYDRAMKEDQVIASMRGKYNLSDEKIAVKIYVKAVQEKVFTTVVGYAFLNELRDTILSSGKISEKKLPVIPVKDGAQTASEEPSAPAAFTGKDAGGRFKRLYEGQRLLNKRLKVIIFFLFVLIAAIVVIDMKSEYSIFTFFTDYKSNMEEELINKYEKWESELNARESELNEREGVQ